MYTSLSPTKFGFLVCVFHAQTVADLMERMRVEMFGNSASAREIVPQVDAVVLLDRSVDLLTPLSTQLTYEGLIDEVFGIKHCECLHVNW